MDTSLNTTWTYTVDENIISVIHRALSKMLKDFTMAAELTNVKVRYSQLRMWHVEYLKKFWDFFEQIVKQHNDNVVNIVSPWMTEKVALSSIDATQQDSITQRVAEIKTIISSLLIDNTAITFDIDCLIKNLNELKGLFQQHFIAREEGMLTTIHKCYTQKEFKVVQDKLMLSYSNVGYGWLLDSMPSRKKRNKWLKNVAQVSLLTRWSMLEKDYAKFTKHTNKLLVDIMTSH
jgi:hypothetical protein